MYISIAKIIDLLQIKYPLQTYHLVACTKILAETFAGISALPERQISKILNQTDIFSGILLKKPSNCVNISLKTGISEPKPSIALGPQGAIKE